MTKLMMNKSIARLGASLIFTGIFLFHSGAVKAQAASPAPADSATVTYIGSQDGSYIFNVQFDNAAGETYVVAVVDDAGNTLYKGLYSDRKFDRKFKIPAEEDIDKVSFVIRNLHSKAAYTYAVNTSIRTVKDVTIERTH